MKWIGQHIYDFISRFRNDVYLEDVESGTIASGSNLGLDSNNKIVKADASSGDLTAVVAGTGLSGTDLSGPIPTLNVDAAQTGITSLGTLTALTVDNITINGDTITASGDLALVATGNDITIDTDNVVIESATESEPILTLKATHTTVNKSGELKFLKDAADTEDNESLGRITFYGEDEGNNSTLFSFIKGKIAESDEGAEGGKLQLAVVTHDGEMQIGLEIIDGNAEDEIDVTIANGAASVTTIAGKLTCASRTFTVQGATDGQHHGDVCYFGNTTSMTIGKIYHYKSDGTWEIANADAVATSDGLLAVALCAASDTNGMLLRGIVVLDHDPGAMGDVLFVQSDNAGTPGDATATAPSASGDCVRIIGYQISHASNGNIWFNPDNTFVEVA